MLENIQEIMKYTKKLKLLYVEDDADAREATLLVFGEFFDDIVVAINGEDGVEKFEDASFDLIITDINMPKMNGLDMIEKIRESGSSVPVLILSAHNESDYFQKSIKLDVDGYIFKPIELKQFLKILNKVIDDIKLLAEMKKNLHFLQEYKKMTNESSIVSKTDITGKITYVNDKFCEISGYSREELLGKNHNIIRHPDTPKELFRELWDTIKNKKKSWRGLIKNRAKNGKSYFVDTHIKPLLDVDGKIVKFIALRNDVTEIMNPKRQLDNAIKNAKEPLVVLLRLEDFQMLEEFYDDATIEEIQEKITQHLEENLLKSCKFDKVYRLGSGQYGMVGEREQHFELKDEEEFRKKLQDFQETIKHTYVDLGDINYDVSVLISYAYKDTSFESAKLGLKKLLETKESFINANGLAQLQKEQARENIKTLAMIKNAIEEYKIISYFQPIINNKTQKIEKYESLVRLVNAQGDVLSPFFFRDSKKRKILCANHKHRA